jgi:hypothetical protein
MTVQVLMSPGCGHGARTVELLSDVLRAVAPDARLENRRRKVEAGLAGDLPAVLRTDAPAFDLEAMLARFDRLWRRN